MHYVQCQFLNPGLILLGGVGFLWIDGQSVLIVSQLEIKFPGALRGVGMPVFLESLILAQDERWRRA